MYFTKIANHIISSCGSWWLDYRKLITYVSTGTEASQIPFTPVISFLLWDLTIPQHPCTSWKIKHILSLWYTHAKCNISHYQMLFCFSHVSDYMKNHVGHTGQLLQLYHDDIEKAGLLPHVKWILETKERLFHKTYAYKNPTLFITQCNIGFVATYYNTILLQNSITSLDSHTSKTVTEKYVCGICMKLMHVGIMFVL